VTESRKQVAQPRGRPRSEKSREAILHSAAALLLERGLDAVSMDAVAQHAGVSKATIYRWWSTKEALALDALYAEWAEHSMADVDTGSLRGDLLALLRPWVRQLRKRNYARVLGTFITKVHSDPEFATEYLARLLGPRRDMAKAMFERARERGELRPGVRIEVAQDIIWGAVYHRLLHGHAPLSDRFVTEVVDVALQGFSPR
jgi:AcrR family transcriptional regulator